MHACVKYAKMNDKIGERGTLKHTVYRFDDT